MNLHPRTLLFGLSLLCGAAAIYCYVTHAADYTTLSGLALILGLFGLAFGDD